MFIFVACSGKRFCSLGSSVCTWWDERRLPTGTRHSSCPSIIHATRQLIQNRTLYIDLISPWSDFSTNFVFAVSFFNLSFWIFAFLATDKLPNLIVYSRYWFWNWFCIHFYCICVFEYLYSLRQTTCPTWLCIQRIDFKTKCQLSAKFGHMA